MVTAKQQLALTGFDDTMASLKRICSAQGLEGDAFDTNVRFMRDALVRTMQSGKKKFVLKRSFDGFYGKFESLARDLRWQTSLSQRTIDNSYTLDKMFELGSEQALSVLSDTDGMETITFWKESKSHFEGLNPPSRDIGSKTAPSQRARRAAKANMLARRNPRMASIAASTSQESSGRAYGTQGRGNDADIVGVWTDYQAFCDRGAFLFNAGVAEKALMQNNQSSQTFATSLRHRLNYSIAESGGARMSNLDLNTAFDNALQACLDTQSTPTYGATSIQPMYDESMYPGQHSPQPSSQPAEDAQLAIDAILNAAEVQANIDSIVERGKR